MLNTPLWLWRDGTLSPPQGMTWEHAEGCPGLFRNLLRVIPKGTMVLILEGEDDGPEPT